jgi:uncharacterized protein (UPF0333 family)
MILLRRRDDRGAAALEFALVVPLLMVLVFGGISFGYMLSFRQAISQSAAEGARAAAVAPAGTNNAQRNADAVAAVNNGLGSYGVTCTGAALVRNGVTVGSCGVSHPAPCTNGSGDCVRVTLDYAYRDNPLLPSFFVGAVLPSNLRYATEVQVS